MWNSISRVVRVTVIAWRGRIKRPLEGSISRSSHLLAEKNQSAIFLRLIKLAFDHSFTFTIIGITDATDLLVSKIVFRAYRFAASEISALKRFVYRLDSYRA